MYINFQKFNYKLVSNVDRARYEHRDQDAYKKVLRDWLESNIEQQISRKWEIDEILYIKEIREFIKPVREAESLYEFGFYMGCIALVGVSSEDFSKYLSLKHGKTDHITGTYSGGKRTGQSFDVSQYDRLNKQLNESLIDQQTYDLLDAIRRIRNDCLHFNQSFKQKSDSELKTDAITTLNSIKSVLKWKIGTTPDPQDILELMDEMVKAENNKCFEDVVWKQKNMLSHLLEFSTVQDPNVKRVEKSGHFKVTDLDDEEIELTELEINPSAGMKLIFCVDIDAIGKTLIISNDIQADDLVIAEVYSDVDSDGQTRLWYLSGLIKIGT